MTDLLVLCTGNAARSVMAGFMLEHLRDGRPGDPLHIVTAGTHTIDGQPMGNADPHRAGPSSRTRGR